MFPSVLIGIIFEEERTQEMYRLVLDELFCFIFIEECSKYEIFLNIN